LGLVDRDGFGHALNPSSCLVYLLLREEAILDVEKDLGEKLLEGLLFSFEFQVLV